MKKSAKRSSSLTERFTKGIDKLLAMMGETLDSCEWFPGVQQTSQPPRRSAEPREATEAVMEASPCIELRS